MKPSNFEQQQQQQQQWHCLESKRREETAESKITMEGIESRWHVH